MTSSTVLLPVWRRWLSAAVVLISAAFFTRCNHEMKVKVKLSAKDIVRATPTQGVILLPAMPESRKEKLHLKKKAKAKFVEFTTVTGDALTEDVMELDQRPLVADSIVIND